MTMNAHQLRHYVYFVRRFGPLWVYSCFGFETMNGCLTNMIHGTRHIAEQVYYNHYHYHYHHPHRYYH